MRGPWRDRTYVPKPLQKVQPPATGSADPDELDVFTSTSLLAAYAAGAIGGALVGFVILWLVLPYLPFAGTR